MTEHFDKLSQPRVRQVLNVLVEAPFFYRSDDPDLFAFLRRNRAEFARFYEELYGWELVVDAQCARVYKTQWHNPALKPSQHDVFDLTRRDECIAFLIVLEFHEHLLDERDVSIDDPQPPRFEFGELFAFARSRLTEVLGEEAGDDLRVRRLLRGLMPTLLRFRFLSEIEPEPDERAAIDDDRMLYECLPALHHYDARLMGPRALERALAASAVPETAEATEEPAS
jgi:hypothetical protein